MNKSQKLPIILLSICILITIINTFFIFGLPKMKKYSMKVYRENIEYSYEGARADLIKTMDEYIDSVAPQSFLNASAIFDACDEYDVDMIFVLSQCQLESQFGTKGTAASTNSVCNVGAYDNLTVDKISHRHKYKHPDLSIRPYVELLCDNYLVNGKTEKDMMIKYVNASGKRYATAENYEDKLYAIYKNISQYSTADGITLQQKVYTYNKFKTLVNN